MLSTCIRDVFRTDERSAITAALDELCAPTDSYGWASAGIYCFWNPDTHEALYIGLAVDLATRFKQHTGLTSCPTHSCKREMIDQYFGTHDRLGYSILVQTPLDQPIFAANRGQLPDDLTPDLEESIELVEVGRDRIKLSEGALIEACVKNLGKRPPWNRIGGSKEGQEVSLLQHFNFIRWLVADIDEPFVARSTLREIAADPELEGIEEVLHAARMLGMAGMPLTKAVEFLCSDPTSIQRYRFDRMAQLHYLARRAPFNV
jgi:hypothetical protein